MTCDHVEELFVELEDGHASDSGSRRLLDDHLSECEECRARCAGISRTLQLARRIPAVPSPGGRFWINYPALVRMRILERRRARRLASLWGAATACTAGVALLALFWSPFMNTPIDGRGTAHMSAIRTRSVPVPAAAPIDSGVPVILVEKARDVSLPWAVSPSSAPLAVAFMGKPRSRQTSNAAAVVQESDLENRAGSVDDDLFASAASPSFPEARSVENEIDVLIAGESSLGDIEMLLDLYEDERGVPDGIEYRMAPELWDEMDVVDDDSQG